ncbi:hypothetical protein [Streptomyces werraensis]|uniref:hypothetical protein n=1 Tax=Streptomyces werraensis TaxID=68284 RepID=UPI0033A211EB
MRPAFRLWSGVLMLCVLTFCLTGIARPAMVMSGPMGQGQQADERAVADTSEWETAMTVSSGMQDHCPAVSDHRGRTTAAPAPGVPAVPAPAEGPREVWDAQPWPARAGPAAASPASPPPDLHRICVLRT